MALAKWQRGWPRGGDVKHWMRCLLSKAGAITDLRERVRYTSLAIEELAKRGSLKEAVTELERLLHGLPADDGLHHVSVLELGAKLHLQAEDMKKMEEYLQRILATKPLHQRKCDRGWEMEVVRKFKLFHGLLETAEATDEKERVEAAFKCSMRRINELIDQNDKAAVRAELSEAEKIIARMPEDWQRRHAYEEVLDYYMKLKDQSAAKRLARRLLAEDEDALDGKKLWEIGLRREAVMRIEDDLEEALDGIASFNPNVHHFGSQIKDLLLFLINIGKEGLARGWLARVLAEGQSWTFHERGFASAALFQSLASVVSKLDGIDAAEQLMSLAMSDSKNEKRRAWRGHEVGSSIDLLVRAGRIETALEMARAVRSPGMRRVHLVSLLAGSGRWKELSKVLAEAKTPVEAAELCWSVKFALEPKSENE